MYVTFWLVGWLGVFRLYFRLHYCYCLSVYLLVYIDTQDVWTKDVERLIFMVARVRRAQDMLRRWSTEEERSRL
jgi:hypothetical protein